MDASEVARLVGEIIAIITFAAAAIWWITKLLWRIYNQGQNLREGQINIHGKLDALNGSVAKHASQLNTHENKIAYLEGKEAARIELAAAALAAAEIVKDAAATAKQLIRDVVDKEQQQ